MHVCRRQQLLKPRRCRFSRDNSVRGQVAAACRFAVLVCLLALYALDPVASASAPTRPSTKTIILRWISLRGWARNLLHRPAASLTQTASGQRLLAPDRRSRRRITPRTASRSSTTRPLRRMSMRPSRARRSAASRTIGIWRCHTADPMSWARWRAASLGQMDFSGPRSSTSFSIVSSAEGGVGFGLEGGDDAVGG